MTIFIMRKFQVFIDNFRLDIQTENIWLLINYMDILDWTLLQQCLADHVVAYIFRITY
jgi:hypothetical protein